MPALAGARRTPAAGRRPLLALAGAALASAVGDGPGCAAAGRGRCKGDGTETVQGRHVGAFTSLAVHGEIYTEAKLDSWPEVNIFAFANVADSIRTEVAAEELNISATEGACVADASVQISTLSPLSSLAAAGGGSVLAEAVLGNVLAEGGSNVTVGTVANFSKNASAATLRVIGRSSKAWIGEVAVSEELRIEVEGDASLSISQGHARSVVILSNGPASVRLGGLKAERTEVRVAGGTIELPASRFLSGVCRAGGRLSAPRGWPEASELEDGGCEVVKGAPGSSSASLANTTTTTEVNTTTTKAATTQPTSVSQPWQWPVLSAAVVLAACTA